MRSKNRTLVMVEAAGRLECDQKSNTCRIRYNPLSYHNGVYVAAQCSGGLAGAAVAHLMFGLPLFSLSRHARSGGAQVQEIRMPAEHS
jgi:hypothetical protein